MGGGALVVPLHVHVRADGGGEESVENASFPGNADDARRPPMRKIWAPIDPVADVHIATLELAICTK